MIKILITDDSGFMRIALRKMLEKEPDVKIVGEAANGAIAVKMAEELRPDIITMDLEMPEMNGFEAIQHIMQRFPTPIIVISSLTQAGVNETFRALELGAVDYISKSSSFVQLDIAHIEKELREKIRFWAKRSVPEVNYIRQDTPLVLHTMNQINPNTLRRVNAPNQVDLVVVGVSTGGPRMLPEMLQHMGDLSCPVVIAQHMPAAFTASFAEHLQMQTGLKVVEGSHGMTLEPGVVVIAPGGTSSYLRLSGNKFIIQVQQRIDAPVQPWVDLLFKSAIKVAKNPVAVILTGMGNDGTEGARDFAHKGLPVLVQEPSGCVVDGMPGSAIQAGVASEALSLERIGNKLARWAGKVRVY